MMHLEALLLDLDGTLADTEREGHRVAFNRAFAERGLDWCWSVESYGRLLAVTGGKERIAHFIATRQPTLPEGVDLDAFIAELHRRKTHLYTQALAQGGIPPRPGVLRLLREARSAGLKLAIVTTTTPQNVTALIEATLGREGLDWFAVIAAGDLVPAKKPAPDIYRYALRRLGVGPGACVAFEDSAAGLRAARGAGIGTVVIIVNDYTRDQDFTDAAQVLDGLGEPAAPCRRMAGLLDAPGWVDLEWVRRLHRAVSQGGA